MYKQYQNRVSKRTRKRKGQYKIYTVIMMSVYLFLLDFYNQMSVYALLATFKIRAEIKNGNVNPSIKFLEEFLHHGIRERYWGLSNKSSEMRKNVQRSKRAPSELILLVIISSS